MGKSSMRVKVDVILWDNARNMENTQKEADIPSLPCMVHMLQLVGLREFCDSAVSLI